MLFFLYEIGLYLLALIAFPKMFFQMLRHKKYRLSFPQRWGTQSIEKHSEKSFTVWIHAVSVGETKAVAPIARMIKDVNPKVRLIVSSITETGQAEAKRCIPFADEYLFLPFDFRWTVRPLVQWVRPQVVILSESDFWLNFLRAAKAEGASILLVNGKLSQRSFKRFSTLKSLSDTLFSLFNLLCVQNKAYEERFTHLGIEQKRLVVTGNLKFDQEYPVMAEVEKAGLKEKMGLGESCQLLVLGSTHAPEEQQILERLKKIWNLFPRLKVLIVPRHPERFKEVADLLHQARVGFVRFSELGKVKVTQPVILMDAMGLLKKCYQVADLAIVGGSFVKHVGGHNILEPCGYGVPVIFGPHMHAQEELVNLALDYGAGVQVTMEHLDNTIVHFLEDAKARHDIGTKGLKLMEDNRGSSRRTWEAIQSYIVSEELALDHKERS